MIAYWMIYSIALSALIAGASLAVERLCIALRWPTRWLWVAGIVLSLGGAANEWRLINARPATDSGSLTTVVADAPSQSVVVARDDSPRVGTVVSRRPNAAIRTDLTRIVAAARHSLAFDPGRFDSLGPALLSAWIAVSSAALLYLVVAFVGIRRLTRGMPSGVVDGHPVLLSRDIGPALIGVLRARIVVPLWVAELREAERRLVLAHESEHAAAGDPMLLVAGLVLAALQAWNVALWFAVARLRFSIETDCDARVLRRLGDARSYGRLLIRVHTQSTPILAARLAFTGATTKLESRIRRLLGVGRPRTLASAVLAASCTIVVIASACVVPTPLRPIRVLQGSAAAPAYIASAAPRQVMATEKPATRGGSAEAIGGPAAEPTGLPRRDGGVAAIDEPPHISTTARSIQLPAQNLGCGSQSDRYFGPSFAAVRRMARERHGDLFEKTQTVPTVIAFAVDGVTCSIVRDTVFTLQDSDNREVHALFAQAFPDSRENVPLLGIADADDRHAPNVRGIPSLVVVYGLVNMPRERASCAGVTVTTNSICSIDGEVIVRVMDSVRVLVATENHLFMFTSAEPLADIHSATIRLGHVEYAGGAVRVLRWNPEPTIVLGVRNGDPSPFDGRPGRRYENGLGLSHYTPAPVPLDAVGRLKVAPCPDSDAPVGSCFEADGKLIRFPR